MNRKDSRLLAFYLPQYHPIPENNEWWGAGFTEWTNVTRGVPLFEGHYQPHRPGNLGFYDLRLEEVREQQAQLAREAGVHGFVYYHYWFSGRRLLERPFEEVLQSGKPDFPFCLCWANEPWSRNWDGNSRQVLMPQEYSLADDEAHIAYFIRAFRDRRYITVNGRPLLLVYRCSSLPDARATFALWRVRCREAGLREPFICSVQSFPSEHFPPAKFGADAAVEFKPNCTDHGPTLRATAPLDVGYALHRIWPYETMVSAGLKRPIPQYPYFQGICPSWDNSVRRRFGAAIFKDATPEKYGAWLQQVLRQEDRRPQSESLIFINAWNEWAEGNHLEPCERFGKGYLKATRNVLDAHAAWQAAMESALVGGEFDAVGRDGYFGNIEYGDVLSGWCVSRATILPPDWIFLAVRTAGGKYRRLTEALTFFEARPDVAALHGDGALLSGWRFVGKVPPGACIVAYFKENDEFACIGEIKS